MEDVRLQYFDNCMAINSIKYETINIVLHYSS